jgi:SAM-dependent methyltransferase
MPDSYEKFAQIYDEFVRTENPEQINSIKRWVLILFGWMGYGKSCGPLLDLGCGTGNYSLPLTEFGYNVVGVDLSGPMLKKAAEQASRRGLSVEFINQDIRRLDIPKEFGCIFSKQTITHVSTAQGLLETFEGCHRHLLPGGHFVFEVPTLYELRSICEGKQDSFLNFDWASSGVFDEAGQIASVVYKFNFRDRSEFTVGLSFKFHPLQEIHHKLSQAGFREILFLETNFAFQQAEGGLRRIVHYPVSVDDPKPINELKSIMVHAVKA